jgi:hypothetical protein
VSIVVHAGDALKAATSTDVDGRYTILFSPNATYRVTAELTAFGAVDRTITLGPAPCDTTADIELALRSRRESINPTPAATSNTPAQPSQNTEAAPSANTPPVDQRAAAGASDSGGRGRGGAPRGANGRGAGAGARQGFQTLNVQPDANGEATLGLGGSDDGGDAARLLPSGFSLQDVQSDAVAISGSNDATNVDRGQLNDRAQFLTQAIAQGNFDPATGQFAQGFAPGGFDGGGPGAGGQFGGQGGGGGRGGGGGGRGGFFLGGRGARNQSPYQGTATYTFGGSVLNAAPYQINPDVPVTQPQFAQNSFGTTFGGPLKIPGVYKDTNRRTNFQLNYTGNRANNVFDQYATVPTQAMRSGNLSGSPIQLINPRTGQPLANNQIPASAMNPSAQYLLNFIPQPNTPANASGGDNYHVSTLANTASDSLSVRVTQNLSSTPPPQNGRGGRGGFGGFGGGRGGRGAIGGRGTNVVLQAQLQYRRNEAEAPSVFPTLGSRTTNTSFAVPISLNVVRNRFINNFTVNVTHSSIDTSNNFANVQNVGGLAGINYPAGASSVLPQYWGVPGVSLAGGLTGMSGTPAALRTDTRITTSYVWSHPTTKHQLRLGVDYRIDRDMNQLNANAPGAFTFTGLYSSGGGIPSGLSPALTSLATQNAAFADFLLGAPQQATLQVGGVSELRGRSFDTYFEDNWQKSPKLTVNYGVRYELVFPYTDANGHLVNLDAAPGFAAVAPVLAGARGPFSGAYPAAVINTDTNNIGPRVGLAFRPVRGTTIRGGYSITYNPNSYANIARRLASQPQPGFADTETVLGSTTTPLLLQDALLESSPTTTTNNWGVDKNYQLGLIQTWNASITRDLTPVWNALVSYTGIKGTDLDLLNAPNRNSSGGLLIATVQPFTWESSGGHSLLNQANFTLTRRLAKGVGGSASYTLTRSMDDTPSLGAGVIVPQNPLDVNGEWALSNFDRREQFAGNLLWELPFGSGRRWLDKGGMFAELVGGWTATVVWTLQTGTPYSVRVCGAATDVAQGTTCTLRANLTGAPITVSDPTLLTFFDTAAFAAPPIGTYGDSPRNVLFGPGVNVLNGTLVRDIRLGGVRNLTLQINANNMLNSVVWSGIDTNPLSRTYGNVISVRPMRSVTFSMRFRF